MYNIYRFYSDGRGRKLRQSGLTLKQAQEWCADPETSSITATKGRGGCKSDWFEGYEKQ